MPESFDILFQARVGIRRPSSFRARPTARFHNVLLRRSEVETEIVTGIGRYRFVSVISPVSRIRPSYGDSSEMPAVHGLYLGVGRSGSDSEVSVMVETHFFRKSRGGVGRRKEL